MSDDDDEVLPDDLILKMPIEDSIDLHTFQPREVRDVVFDYLCEARALGHTEVRVIHGRGIGVQREIVRSLLSEIDWVESFADADPRGGGWGATVVRMRPA